MNLIINYMDETNFNENKLKHLELIQGVITRMAGNLFYLRGWVITLVAGVLALLSQISGDVLPFLLVILVMVISWIYDGYFLALERMYRDLYEKVRKLNPEKVDFSMSVEEFKKYKKNTIFFCMLSSTLLFFYAPLIASAIYLAFNAN